jgi:hypothetical protein
MKSLAAVLLVLMTAGAAAQERPPTLKLAPALNTPLAQDLLELFRDICVKQYPNEKAVIALVEKAGGRELPESTVRGALRGDKGRGWIVEAGGDAFLVTLKPAPDRHCAVRATADKPFAPSDWRSLLRAMAQAQKETLSGDIDYDHPQPDGGMAHVFSNLLTAVPMENLMMVVQEFRVKGKKIYETRLMRRLMPSPRSN